MITLDTLQSLIAGNVGVAFLASFLAGVFTSLSPCIMAMVPMVLGYVGAFGSTDSRRSFLLVLSLVAGLSTSFSVLGLAAALLGGIFGNVSRFAPMLLGAVFMVMGLSLMKIITLPTAGLSKLPIRAQGFGGAYMLGLVFGLAASPCASGMLAVIVSFAAVSGRVLTGVLLLFAYGLGNGVPLLIIGSAAGALKSFRRASQYWDYFAYLAGLLFVGAGAYLIFRSL